jgi:hypothetical protein
MSASCDLKRGWGHCVHTSDPRATPAFVERLGPDPKAIAAGLIDDTTGAQVQAWSQGTASDWAMEPFQVAKQDVYGWLPKLSKRHSYRLTEAYVGVAV